MNGNIVEKNLCSICDEIENEQEAGFFYQHIKKVGDNEKNRILYEDEHFVVWPSLGPIAECHLLVIPKEHVCSYAVLDERVVRKAERLITKIERYVRQRYGSCIVFEHGVLSEEMQGSASCTHAHMHIVTCPKSILMHLKKDGLQMREIVKLEELKEQLERGKPYFYYRENEEFGYLMDDTIQKSQYMRRLIADILGTPEKGDWKKNFGIPEVKKMMEELKGDLGEHEFNCSSRPKLGNR